MEPADPIGQVVTTNLRNLRQKRRWTLDQTAEKLAVHLDRKALSPGGLSRWENPDNPRRFSMTELFAICSTFEIPLARLFLPDRDADIPTINDVPYHAVWRACFSGTERLLPDWQLLEQAERHPPGTSHYPFSDGPEAEAMERLRDAGSPPADDGEPSSDE